MPLGNPAEDNRGPFIGTYNLMTAVVGVTAALTSRKQYLFNFSLLPDCCDVSLASQHSWPSRRQDGAR